MPETFEVFGPQGWHWFESGTVEQWPKIEVIYCDDKGKILPDEYQTIK